MGEPVLLAMPVEEPGEARYLQWVSTESVVSSQHVCVVCDLTSDIGNFLLPPFFRVWIQLNLHYKI